jgi:hypothetical protein
MLGDVSATFALAEQMEEAFSPESALTIEEQLAMDAGEPAITDGEVTVKVRSDGPLKTMLTSKRIPPGQRHTESVFAA